jgi:hypothetical protein
MEISIAEEDDTERSVTNLSAMTLNPPYPYSNADEDVSPHVAPVAVARNFVPTPTVRDISQGKNLPLSHIKGRTSPDIQSIISATPRPRRRTSSILSASSSVRSKSRPSSEVPSSHRASAASSTTNVLRTLRGPDQSELSYDQQQMITLDNDGSEFDELERELEGNGSESDSSLDLQTPFA